MAQTYQLLVFLNPVAGREDEFHQWYEHTHLDEVMQTAGFRWSQRFAVEHTVGMEMPLRHLALYETEADSAEEVLDRLNATRDQRQQTDTMDMSSFALWVITPLGERHVVDG